MTLTLKLNKPIYKITEVADLLGVPISKVRYDIADGLLDARKVGKLIFVSADKLKEYAELFGLNCELELNDSFEVKNEGGVE